MRLYLFRVHRYGLLVCLFSLFNLLPQGQDLKKQPAYEHLYAKAERLLKTEPSTAVSDSLALNAYMAVINLLDKHKNYNAVLADSYLKCGILKMGGDDSAALYFFHQAVLTVRRGSQLPDSLLFKPYLYAGSIQYDLNNLDSAVYYYKKAEVIYRQYPALDEAERLFNKFGALYYETGDYKKSIGYFRQALSFVTGKKPTDSFFTVNYKSNIATALLKMGEYQQALVIFNEILPYHITQDQLFYNAANAYTEEEDYTKALRYLRQIRRMDMEKYTSMAKVFIRLAQYDSARAYLAKASIVYADKKNSIKKIDYGITLKYAGDLEAVTGNLSKAVTDYQVAITQLDPVFTDTAAASNPVSFTGLRNFAYLFETLVAKAAAFNKLYATQPDLNYPVNALNAYASALALARHIERTYFSDDARLFLKNKVNPAVRDAVATAIVLFRKSADARYINIAFGFAETNKASVLQSGLQDIELLAVPGLPAGLVEEEKKYKSLLAKLAVQSNQPADSTAAVSLQKNIRENELALSAIQEKLDENPFFHQLKFNNNTIDADSLRHTLQKDEIVLSYYYTENQLLCFYVTSTALGVSSTELRSNLFNNIKALRKNLENPEGADPVLLKAAGTGLFAALISPVQDKIKSKKRLIVIPYNEISYIPFELLQDGPDGELLLRNYAISYQYAAGFLTGKKNNPVQAYNVLALAPFSGNANNENTLPPLPASAGEIDHLPGKQLYGPAATRQQFITLSGQYPVIHLATHAIANDTNLLGSFIEFYHAKNDADTAHRLYEQEIYALDLKQARLVILSACETGNGLLVNGEGVMSLSRAFSYAGCKSVITSLWKADDMSTAFIVKRLHEYLQKGLAKDEALQKAKLDYINDSGTEDRFKNPANWAHLVLIGDYHPLVKSGFARYTGILIIILVLAALFILRKKKDRV